MTEIHSEKANSENQREEKLMSTEFNKELTNQYFMKIQGELNQIDQLVNNAVTNLVINFEYISDLTKLHHDLFTAIEKLTATEGNISMHELFQKQLGIAEKIERELEMAVTSLQFGDLVTQLLTHTSHQVETLNAELHRHCSSTSKDSEESISEHEGINNAVSIASTKCMKKPVAQHGIQIGDVELF